MKAFVFYLAAAVSVCVTCFARTAHVAEVLNVPERLTHIAQGPALSQAPKVHPEVTRRVRDRGIAKVGVTLSGQWELDVKLQENARELERQAIAAAQQSLLAELVGMRHRVLWRSKFGPFLSLEIGLDTLAVLEISPLVKEVYLEEGWGKPAPLDSVPLIGGQRQ
jgi:hypothetical protein